VAACSYVAVCGFHQQRVPVTKALHATSVEKYCNAAFADCAINQVIAKKTFLKVPRDLQPGQRFRVSEILR
jgi:hypothetical protein